MKPWGAFTLVSACFISAAGIIGHNLPKPEPMIDRVERSSVSDRPVMMLHYGAKVPNLPAGMELDISYDTFPGTFDEAITTCDQFGGELILYSDVADLSKAVCEGVKY